LRLSPEAGTNAFQKIRRRSPTGDFLGDACDDGAAETVPGQTTVVVYLNLMVSVIFRRVAVASAAFSVVTVIIGVLAGPWT
jgi:hypothetical protein